MVIVGSGVSSAVEIQNGAAPAGSISVEVVFRPRISQMGVPVSCKEVASIPTSSVSGAGFYFTASDNPSETRYYFEYDPKTDTIYAVRNAGNSEALQYRQQAIGYFTKSAVYKRYLFKQSTPQLIDVKGLAFAILKVVQKPLLMLLGVVITLNLLETFGRRTIRSLEEKQSKKDLQDILARDSILHDPYVLKQELRRHSKDYTARHKRYKREDAARKRRGYRI